MSDKILEIDSVKKSFTRNIINIRGRQEDERFFILDELDLDIEQGKITALIGGNGAGKTTLFNAVSGLMKIDEGDILFRKNGKAKSIINLPPYKITQLGIGRMFQDDHIFPDLSVLDNMKLAGSNIYGEFPFLSLIKAKKSRSIEKERTDKARKIFQKLFGNDNYFWRKRNDPAKSLSYGQQRLLGLARLFMGNYKLVLLDEPTAGVNPQVINQIIDIVRQMVEEKNLTVFLVEHNMEVVLRLADYCNFMSHGKIAVVGTPEDVIGNDEVRKTYMGI
jgi:branched-chain amino acid transport system ATP-binding protein